MNTDNTNKEIDFRELQLIYQSYDSFLKENSISNAKRMETNIQSKRNSFVLSTNEDPSTYAILKEISLIAFPVAICFLCTYLQQTLIISFLGRKYNNPYMIEGVGTANVYINCFLLSIVTGITSAYDTFGSNAFGVKNYRSLGLYYHLSIIVAYSIAVVFLIFHYFFAVKLINLFGLNDQIMSICSDYIQIYMLFVLFDILYILNFRYLNIVEKSYVNVIILVWTLILHFIWCYILIYVFDLGVKGAAISLVFTQFLNALFSSIYILYYSPYPESIFPFCNESFEKWKEYLQLSLPATFLLCAEFWSFEFNLLICLWCSDLDYTVFIIVHNIGLNCYSIPAGFGTASTIIPGAYISQHNIQTVKRIKNIIIVYGMSITSIISLILILIRNEIIDFYIINDQIKEKGIYCTSILAIVILFDMYQTIFMGYFRGIGKYALASIICFVNFYILMLFFGVLFGKVLGNGAKGVIWAVSISLLLTCIIYTIAEWFFDYELLYREALQRANAHCSRTSSFSILREHNGIEMKLLT